MRDVYFHERDEHGAIQPRIVGAEGPDTDEERLRARWRAQWALSEAQLDMRWREFIQQEAYRDRLERQRDPVLTAAEIEERVRTYRREQVRRREG